MIPTAARPRIRLGAVVALPAALCLTLLAALSGCGLVATSDGQRVLCAGTATRPVNPGGATEVGLWVFSARTGTLTAAWNKHTICCAPASTGFPHLRWVSPHGDLLIADGLSTHDQGAQLFLRAADGTLRQLPWPGLIRRPNQAALIEPSIAW